MSLPKQLHPLQFVLLPHPGISPLGHVINGVFQIVKVNPLIQILSNEKVCLLVPGGDGGNTDSLRGEEFGAWMERIGGDVTVGASRHHTLIVTVSVHSPALVVVARVRKVHTTVIISIHIRQTFVMPQHPKVNVPLIHDGLGIDPLHIPHVPLRFSRIPTRIGAHAFVTGTIHAGSPDEGPFVGGFPRGIAPAPPTAGGFVGFESSGTRGRFVLGVDDERPGVSGGRLFGEGPLMAVGGVVVGMKDHGGFGVGGCHGHGTEDLSCPGLGAIPRSGGSGTIRDRRSRRRLAIVAAVPVAEICQGGDDVPPSHALRALLGSRGIIAQNAVSAAEATFKGLFVGFEASLGGGNVGVERLLIDHRGGGGFVAALLDVIVVARRHVIVIVARLIEEIGRRIGIERGRIRRHIIGDGSGRFPLTMTVVAAHLADIVLLGFLSLNVGAALVTVVLVVVVLVVVVVFLRRHSLDDILGIAVLPIVFVGRKIVSLEFGPAPLVIGGGKAERVAFLVHPLVDLVPAGVVRRTGIAVLVAGGGAGSDGGGEGTLVSVRRMLVLVAGGGGRGGYGGTGRSGAAVHAVVHVAVGVAVVVDPSDGGGVVRCDGGHGGKKVVLVREFGRDV